MRFHRRHIPRVFSNRLARVFPQKKIRLSKREEYVRGEKKKEKKVRGIKDDGGRFFELSLGRVISKGVEDGEKVRKLRSLDKTRALPLFYHDFILCIVQLICLYTRVPGCISNHG